MTGTTSGTRSTGIRRHKPTTNRHTGSKSLHTTGTATTLSSSSSKPITRAKSIIGASSIRYKVNRASKTHLLGISRKFSTKKSSNGGLSEVSGDQNDDLSHNSLTNELASMEPTDRYKLVSKLNPHNYNLLLQELYSDSNKHRDNHNNNGVDRNKYNQTDLIQNQLVNLPFSYPLSQSLLTPSTSETSTPQKNQSESLVPDMDIIYSHFLAALQPPHFHNPPISSSNSPARSRLRHITHNTGEDTIGFDQQRDAVDKQADEYFKKLTTDQSSAQKEIFQTQKYLQHDIDPSINHPNPFLGKGIAIKKFAAVISSLWAFHNQVSNTIDNDWKEAIKGDPYAGVAKLFAGYGYHHERNVLNLTKLTILEKLIKDGQIVFKKNKIDQKNDQELIQNSVENDEDRSPSTNAHFVGSNIDLRSRKLLDSDNDAITTQLSEHLAVDLSQNGFAVMSEDSDLFLELRNNTLRSFGGDYLSLNVFDEVQKLYPHLEFTKNGQIIPKKSDERSDERSDEKSDEKINDDITPYNGDLTHQIGLQMTLKHLQKGSYVLYQTPVYGNDIDMQNGLRSTILEELNDDFKPLLTIKERAIYESLLNNRLKNQVYDFLSWELSGLHCIDHLATNTALILNEQYSHDIKSGQSGPKNDQYTTTSNHNSTNSLRPPSTTTTPDPLVELLFPKSAIPQKSHPIWSSPHAKLHPDLDFSDPSSVLEFPPNSQRSQNTQNTQNAQSTSPQSQTQLSHLLKSKFNLDLANLPMSDIPLIDTPTGTSISNIGDSHYYSLKNDLNNSAQGILAPVRFSDEQLWEFFLRELTVPFSKKFQEIPEGNRKVDNSGNKIGNLNRHGKAGNLGVNTRVIMKNGGKIDIPEGDFFPGDSETSTESENNASNVLGLEIYNSRYSSKRHNRRIMEDNMERLDFFSKNAQNISENDITDDKTEDFPQLNTNLTENDHDEVFKQRSYFVRGSADFIVRTGSYKTAKNRQKIHVYELWDTKLRRDVSPRDLLQTLSYAVILNQKLQEENIQNLKQFYKQNPQFEFFEQFENYSELSSQNSQSPISQSPISQSPPHTHPSYPKTAKITHVSIVHGTGRISRLPINAAYVQLVARSSSLFQYFSKDFHPLNPPQVPPTAGAGGYYSEFLNLLWKEGSLLQNISEFRENRINSLLMSGFTTIPEVAQAILYHSKSSALPSYDSEYTLLHKLAGYRNKSPLNHGNIVHLNKLRQQVVYIPTITGQSENINITSQHGLFNSGGDNGYGAIQGMEGMSKFDGILYNIPIDHFSSQLHPTLSKMYLAESHALVGSGHIDGGSEEGNDAVGEVKKVRKSTKKGGKISTNLMKLNVPGFSAVTLDEMNKFITGVRYHLVSLLQEAGVIEFQNGDWESDQNNQNTDPDSSSHENPHERITKQSKIPSIMLNFDQDGHGLERFIDQNVNDSTPLVKTLKLLNNNDEHNGGNNDENNNEHNNAKNQDHETQQSKVFDGIIQDPRRIFKLLSSILPDLPQIAHVSTLPTENLIQIPDDQLSQIVMLHQKNQIASLHQLFLHFSLTNAKFQKLFQNKMGMVYDLQNVVDQLRSGTILDQRDPITGQRLEKEDKIKKQPPASSQSLALHDQFDRPVEQILHPLQGLMMLHPDTHTFTFVQDNGLKVLPVQCPQGGDVYFDLEGAGNVIDSDNIILSTFSNKMVKKADQKIRKRYIETFSRLYSIRTSGKLDYLYGLCYKQKLSQWLQEHQIGDQGDQGDGKNGLILDPEDGVLKSKKVKKQVLFKKIDTGLYALSIHEPMAPIGMDEYYYSPEDQSGDNNNNNNVKHDPASNMNHKLVDSHPNFEPHTINNKQRPYGRKGIRSETIYIQIDPESVSSFKNENNVEGIENEFHHGKVTKKLKVLNIVVKNHHISKDGDFDIQLTYPNIKGYLTKEEKKLKNRIKPSEGDVQGNQSDQNHPAPPPIVASETVSNLIHTFITLARYQKRQNNEQNDIAEKKSPKLSSSNLSDLTPDEAQLIYNQLRDTELTVFMDWWGHNNAQELGAYNETVDFLLQRKQKYPMMNIYHYAFYEINALKSNMIRLASNRIKQVEQLLTLRSVVSDEETNGKGFESTLVPFWVKDDQLSHRAEQMLIVAKNRTRLESGDIVVEHGRFDDKNMAKNREKIDKILNNSQKIIIDNYDNFTTVDVDYHSPDQHLTNFVSQEQLVLYVQQTRTQCQAIKYVFNHISSQLPSLAVVIDEINIQIESLIDHYYNNGDGDDDDDGNRVEREIQKNVKEKRAQIERDLAQILNSQLLLLKKHNNFSIDLTDLGYQAQDLVRDVHLQLMDKVHDNTQLFGTNMTPDNNIGNKTETTQSTGNTDIDNALTDLLIEVDDMVNLVCNYIPNFDKNMVQNLDSKNNQNNQNHQNNFDDIIQEYRQSFQIFKTLNDVNENFTTTTEPIDDDIVDTVTPVVVAPQEEPKPKKRTKKTVAATSNEEIHLNYAQNAGSNINKINTSQNVQENQSKNTHISNNSVFSATKPSHYRTNTVYTLANDDSIPSSFTAAKKSTFSNLLHNFSKKKFSTAISPTNGENTPHIKTTGLFEQQNSQSSKESIFISSYPRKPPSLLTIKKAHLSTQNRLSRSNAQYAGDNNPKKSHNNAPNNTLPSDTPKKVYTSPLAKLSHDFQMSFQSSARSKAYTGLVIPYSPSFHRNSYFAAPHLQRPVWSYQGELIGVGSKLFSEFSPNEQRNFASPEMYNVTLTLFGENMRFLQKRDPENPFLMIPKAVLPKIKTISPELLANNIEISRTYESQRDYEKGRLSVLNKQIDTNNRTLGELDNLIAAIFTENEDQSFNIISDATAMGRVIFNFTALRLRIHELLQNVKLVRERCEIVAELPMYYLDITKDIYDDFLDAHNNQNSTNSETSDDSTTRKSQTTASNSQKKKRKVVIEALYTKPNPSEPLYTVDYITEELNLVDQPYNTRCVYSGAIIQPQESDFNEVNAIRAYEQGLKDRLSFIVEELLVRTGDMMISVYKNNTNQQNERNGRLDVDDDGDGGDDRNSGDGGGNAQSMTAIDRITQPHYLSIHPDIKEQLLNEYNQNSDVKLDVEGSGSDVIRNNNNNNNNNKSNQKFFEHKNDQNDSQSPQAGIATYNNDYAQHLHMNLLHSLAILLVEPPHNNPKNAQDHRQKIKNERNDGVNESDSEKNEKNENNNNQYPQHLSYLEKFQKSNETDGVYLANQAETDNNWVDFTSLQGNAVKRIMARYGIDINDLTCGYFYESNFSKQSKIQIKKAKKLLELSENQFELFQTNPENFLAGSSIHSLMRRYKQLSTPEQLEQYQRDILADKKYNSLTLPGIDHSKRLAGGKYYTPVHNLGLYDENRNMRLVDNKVGRLAPVLVGSQKMLHFLQSHLQVNKSAILSNTSPIDRMYAKYLRDRFNSDLENQDKEFVAKLTAIKAAEKKKLRQKKLQKLKRHNNHRQNNNNPELDSIYSEENLSKSDIDEKFENLRKMSIYARLLLTRQFGGLEGYLHAVSTQGEILEKEILALETSKQRTQSGLYDTIVAQHADINSVDPNGGDVGSAEKKQGGIAKPIISPLRGGFNAMLQQRVLLQRNLMGNFNQNSPSVLSKDKMNSFSGKNAAHSVLAALGRVNLVDNDGNSVNFDQHLNNNQSEQYSKMDQLKSNSNFGQDDGSKKVQLPNTTQLFHSAKQQQQQQKPTIGQKLNSGHLPPPLQNNFQPFIPLLDLDLDRNSFQENSSNGEVSPQNSHRNSVDMSNVLSDTITKSKKSHHDAEKTKPSQKLEGKNEKKPTSLPGLPGLPGLPKPARKENDGKLPSIPDGPFVDYKPLPKEQKGPKRLREAKNNELNNQTQRPKKTSQNSPNLPKDPSNPNLPTFSIRTKPIAQTKRQFSSSRKAKNEFDIGTPPPPPIRAVSKQSQVVNTVVLHPEQDVEMETAATVVKKRATSKTAGENKDEDTDTAKGGGVKGSTAQKGAFFDVYPVVRYNIRLSTKSSSLKEVEKLVLDPLKQRKIFLGAVKQFVGTRKSSSGGIIEEKIDAEIIDPMDISLTSPNDDLVTRSGDVQAAKDSLIAYYAWRYRLHTLNNFENIFSKTQNTFEENKIIFNEKISNKNKSDQIPSNSSSELSKNSPQYRQNFTHFLDVDQAVLLSQADTSLYSIQTKIDHTKSQKNQHISPQNSLNITKNINYPIEFTESPEYITPTSFYPPGLSPLPALPSPMMTQLENELSLLKSNYQSEKDEKKIIQMKEEISALENRINNLHKNDNKLHEELISLRDYNKQDCVNLMSLTNWLQDIRLQQRALLELNSNNNGLNSGNNTGVHNNNLNNLANANSSNNANLKMNKIVYDFARVNDDINKASLLITNMDQELKALNGEINQLKHIGTKLGYLNKTLISKEEFGQKSPHKNSSVRNEQNNADNNTENGRTHIPERVLDNKLSDNTMPSGIQLDITVPAPEKRKRAKKEPRKEPEVITGDQQIETKVKQSRKKKPEIRVEEISIPEPDLSLEEAPVPKKRGRPKKVVVM